MTWVYLSGGVGGARLLYGLHSLLPADALTAVVNTGDDFVHWGLRICPDLDTVMYTLAGLSDWQRGWGLKDEGDRAQQMMARYGAEDWFQLGDRDLATHIRRTELLQTHDLTTVTQMLYRGLGVRRQVLPMTHAAVATTMVTRDGRHLPFQHWFVRERCRPPLNGIQQSGDFEDNPHVLSALQTAELVIIGPSNPYVSIAPILFGSTTRALIQEKPIVAMSPLIGGRAVKGPLAQMITQLQGKAANNGQLVDIYESMLGRPLSGFIQDESDPPPRLPHTRVHLATTLMRNARDSQRLATAILPFLQQCAAAGPGATP